MVYNLDINTYFKWVFGGTQVYLTGSMTNWKDHILMEKVKNEYEIVLVIFINLRDCHLEFININLL